MYDKDLTSKWHVDIEFSEDDIPHVPMQRPA